MKASYVVIDAFDNGSYVKVIPIENKIIGYTTRNSGGVPDNFRNYFVIVFDKPFSYKAVVGGNEIRKNELEVKENHLRCDYWICHKKWRNGKGTCGFLIY